VKDVGGGTHPPDVQTVAARASGASAELSSPLGVEAIHAAHADFVWASLQRLGVRDADLPDLLQEVFIVVHRRLDSFDGSSKLTTWLFGIAMRVAAGHRRRAHVRRERATEEIPETAEAHGRAEPVSAEEAAALAEARETLAEILDEMDLERRAVFTMFEVEEMSCEEIAEIVGVPVGTVYSRLHKARKEFEAALARRRARGARGAVQRKGGDAR
jgi:RNA polymerase sigma-70 factor (ECF subfamily)